MTLSASEVEARPDGSTWQLGLVILAAIALRLTVSAVSGFQVDDAWITYRYADHVAAGLGFVYNPGERVYGTTTPLLTLLLAAGRWLGVAPQAAALGIGLLATAATLWVTAAMAAKRVGGTTCWLMLSLLAFCPSHIIWAVSGMETALFVAFLVLGIWAFIERRWMPLGLACGGLFLTRFDGIVFVVAVLACEAFLWVATRDRYRKPMAALAELGRGYGAVLLGLVAVAAPWLLFASWYFHDIVPNSVWAKLALYSVAGYRTSPVELLTGVLRLGFLPWAMELPIVAAGLLALIFRPSRRSIMAVWFFGYLAFLLLGRTHVHPWYLPPFHVVAVLVAFFGFPALPGGWLLEMFRLSGRPQRIVAAAILALAAAVGASSALQAAIARQRTYAHAHADLGRYIRDHAQADDVVYAWDIGYIGYISGRRILDFVGIVSPEVIAANKRRDFAGVLERYRPDWAVVGLYGDAYLSIIGQDWFRTHYRPVYRNRSPGLEAWTDDDPRRLTSYRPEYVVYQRRPATALAVGRR